jgi:hypothetical protein
MKKVYYELLVLLGLYTKQIVEETTIEENEIVGTGKLTTVYHEKQKLPF